MKNHTACETVLLGQTRYCNISHCPECKMYHLHVGPVSLHLKEDVFDSICELLSDIYMQKNKLNEKKNINSLRLN
jgi:hypothetical protein